MLLITKTKVKPPAVKTIKTVADKVYHCSDISLVYGVELEIENLNPEIHPDTFLVSNMTRHEDNSLRNNGWEFVTQPMKLRELEYTLRLFFERGGFSKNNYSERCSTHVHCNTTDMTLDQIQGLLAVYLVYESLLFQWVGADRDKNIFCVPLRETTLTMSMIQEGDLDSWQHKWEKWEKYTALNLKPLFTQGTIEFRHMPGTCDVDAIILWCNLIGKMFAYAKRNSFKDIITALTSLNSSSRYAELTQDIFGEYAHLFMNRPEFTIYLEEGVLNLKYGLVKQQKIASKPSLTNEDVIRLMEQNAQFVRNMQRRNEARGQVRPAANIRDRVILNNWPSPRNDGAVDVFGFNAPAEPPRQVVADTTNQGDPEF
jgi:hypothetical protein